MKPLVLCFFCFGRITYAYLFLKLLDVVDMGSVRFFAVTY